MHQRFFMMFNKENENPFNYVIELLAILDKIEWHPDIPGFPCEETEEKVLSGEDYFPDLPRFLTFAGCDYLNNEYQDRLQKLKRQQE